MMAKAAGALAILSGLVFTVPALAQDLGPQVRKLSDGVYVYVGANFQSNSGIVLTQDGVVLIDTGQNPMEFAKNSGHRQEAHADAGAPPHQHRAA